MCCSCVRVICLFLVLSGHVITLSRDQAGVPVLKREPLSPSESLERDMLLLFGHANRPRPDIFSGIGRSIDTSAKEYMLNLYNEKMKEKNEDDEEEEEVDNNVEPTHRHHTDDSMEDDDEEDSIAESATDADTIVSFVNHGYKPLTNSSSLSHAQSMFFNISSKLRIEKTLASELRVYLDVAKKNISDNVVIVTAYQITSEHPVALASRIINATASGWHEFNIITATKFWQQVSPSASPGNQGLLLTCARVSGAPLSNEECGLLDFNAEVSKRPFLVSFYQSGDEQEILAEQIPDSQTKKAFLHQRIRRSLRNLFPRASDDLRSYKSKDPNTGRKKRDDSPKCRRRSLYIAFEDLGWSQWIIAPKGYQAEFCEGECTFPLGQDMNASNHAVIQTLVALMSPQRIPPPCCAPLRLDPLQVLYLDDNNNVIMKKYNNMAVKNCGCQ